jgi:D-sedoheptulose 7-phosphate isomerase
MSPPPPPAGTVTVLPRSRTRRSRAQLHEHLVASLAAIGRLDAHVAQLDAWAEDLAARLTAGARTLVAGNGGSAALGQHLTAELVGRFRDDRPAFSALALHAETSSVTAIANDYGYESVFARQVEAHGRHGDVLVLLSTSGSSANLLAAADAGRRLGLRCLAMTGPAPNPLTLRCHDTVALDVPSSAAVQEAQQVAVHMLCAAFDRRVSEP